MNNFLLLLFLLLLLLLLVVVVEELCKDHVYLYLATEGALARILWPG